MKVLAKNATAVLPAMSGQFHGIILALVWAIFSPNLQAQRPPRTDLHSLSATEQQALANLIDEWLDEHPYIVEEHVLFFDAGIHNSSNFMPWHRVHLRMLEDFIREKTGNHDYFLPKWQPEITPPNGDKIPLPFQATASGNPLNVGNNIFNPNPAVAPSMSSFSASLEQCASNLSDAGFFSDIEEGKYHNAGHSEMNGRMAQHDSPDCLIFWPWHAWIDEQWRQWEQHCAGEFDIQDVSGDQVIDILSDTSWSGELYAKGKIVVHSGVSLRILPGAILHFLPSDYHAFETGICVMPGGRLIIDGSTLTGMDVFGDGGHDGEKGIKYHSGWNGVTVLGNGGPVAAHQGSIWIKNGGLIEHAKIGILAQNGGRIVAQNARFLNCRIGVKIGPHPYNNFSVFEGCRFINDEALRDVVWMSSPIAGNIVEHHLNHELPHSTEAHLYLDNAVVHAISGCTFDMPFPDPHHYVGGRRGILAFDSKLSVSGSCIFKNLKVAIDVQNVLPGPGRNATIRKSRFINNASGICLLGADFSSVRACLFEVPETADASTDGLVFGIGSDGSAALILEDNTFSTFGGGVSTENCGIILGNTGNALPSILRRNAFDGLGVGVQMQGQNALLQLQCNDFKRYQFGMAITSGRLADQGNCTSAPAGNTWSALSDCIGAERQIFKSDSVPGFVYAAHSNARPDCVSPGILLSDCGINWDEQSCTTPNSPCHCWPKPCCPTDANAGLLKSLKKFLEIPPGYKPLPFKVSQRLKQMAAQATKTGVHARNLLEQISGESAQLVVDRFPKQAKDREKTPVPRTDFLECYPNPAGESLYVRFDCENLETLGLVLSDPSGRRIAWQSADRGQGKTRLARFDTADLAPGLYVVRLEFQGQCIAAKKVLILH